MGYQMKKEGLTNAKVTVLSIFLGKMFFFFVCKRLEMKLFSHTSPYQAACR